MYMASWLPAQPRNPSPQLTRCPLLHRPVPVHAVSTSPPQGVQAQQGRTQSRSGTGSELKISRSVQHWSRPMRTAYGLWQTYGTIVPSG
jgi:hypothetical protein